MSLIFDDTIKSHLNLLTTAPSQVLVDFCRLALEYIRNGPNAKRYNIAAQKLEVPLSTIENAVSGLVNLIINGCKYAQTHEEFLETVASAGFPEEHQETLVKFFEARKPDVTKALRRLTINTPTFVDLQWRLEAQVASRSVPKQIKPSIVMEVILKSEATPTLEQLIVATKDSDVEDDSQKVDKDGKDDTKPNSNFDHVFLQCDIPNLINLTSVLETAMREATAYHIKYTDQCLKK